MTFRRQADNRVSNTTTETGRGFYPGGQSDPVAIIGIGTACSSSLIAVHLACQSIRAGESSMALAGGANLILQPEFSIGFSQGKMLAPDGRCKVFDARANGFVRSEGIGVVVLKPLSRAIADGDPIHAVIRGSAANNDGRSSGLLMTPGCAGQKAVLREACRQAGVAPDWIQYVEAHGTGTSVGDPVEAQAIGAVFGKARQADNPCLIGSVKTNIGHAEAAAGIAGLIKVALCLKHKQIPPSLHFQTPNPNIPWNELALKVQTELTPWPERAKHNGPALASVSAFGISGTNAHVILEEAPQTPPGAERTTTTSTTPHLLTMSAHRRESLRDMAQDYSTFLAGGQAPALRDICYTANARRTHHEHRLAVTGSTHQEMAANLRSFLNGEVCPGVISGRAGGRKPVFVFSGQGSQYLGMGRGLCDSEPVFCNAIKQCDRAIGRYANWSLFEQLFARGGHSRLDELDVAQPALFAVQVALTALWRSWGVEPAGVVGHSMGEVAAAYVAGAISLDDAARIICRRSQLMKRTSGRGAMAVVGLSQDGAERALRGYETRVSISASNSPCATVLSGDPAAIEEVLAALRQQDVFCRPVNVDVASHSPQMEPLCDELARSLVEIRPVSPSIPFCSTVTGEFHANLEADYWARNLRRPVRFAGATERLLEEGYDLFLEVSPRAVLSSSIQQAIKHQNRQAIAIASQHRDEEEQTSMLRALGELYANGCPIDKARCDESWTGERHYEFMRQRGLEYGGSFRGVESLYRRDGEALARLQTAAPMSDGQIDPHLLDACLQAMEAALPQSRQSETYLPVGLGELRIHDRCGADLWSHARLDRTEPPATESDVDELLEGDVILRDEFGQPVWEVLGLRMKRIEARQTQETEGVGEWFFGMQWQAIQPSRPVSIDERGSWLIFADTWGASDKLIARFAERGDPCLAVYPKNIYQTALRNDGSIRRRRIDPTDPAAYRELIDEAFDPGQPPCKGIIHLWSLETLPEDEFSAEPVRAAQEFGCESVMHLVQAISRADSGVTPRLWLVTRGSQAVSETVEPISPAQSTLWGFGKSIAYEHPELRCTMVDLNAIAEPDEAQLLANEILGDSKENLIALRQGCWYASRMTTRRLAALEAEAALNTDRETRVPVAEGKQFHLEVAAPGLLDRLELRAADRQPPQAGQVEIEIHAAGLNFIDVMKAMDIYPGLPDGPMRLGLECAGRIAAVGESVNDWQVGDEVIATSPAADCFGAYVTVPESQVAAKPARMSFEEAATIPIAFLTAEYALHHLGRIRRGERVLIHAAAGGVGLAALQICRRAGAEVYATAGSEEKRDYLRQLGVAHVFDSRSASFARDVMACTGGEGVDVVLNSLAGDLLQAGLSVLREGGRFLEAGKRDIHQNTQLGLLPFRNSLSFSAINLDAVLRRQPVMMGEMFRELMRDFERGPYQPLPASVYPIAETEQAFRQMAQAKHIGKIVIAARQPDVAVLPAAKEGSLLRADASYLITGGLGDLGLLTAEWMVQHGARHLILMGRNGLSKTEEAETVRSAIERLREMGAQVFVAKADVCRRAQLKQALEDLRATMPPLGGVIHAAGLLDDGTLGQITREQLYKVMAPKLDGAWNLHSLTLGDDLDFFVMFSSVASFLGSPGQAAYAAGNAFLDGLANYRRSIGLKALSINWGPWSETGMAARPDRGGRLALRGIESLTPRQSLDALELLLKQDGGQFAVMPFDCARWKEFYPPAARSSLFVALSAEQAAAQSNQPGEAISGLVEAILNASMAERAELAQQYLRRSVAKVLGLSEDKMFGIGPSQPLNRLGLDSLMAIEIKNLIESDLGVTVPMANLLGGAGLADLTSLVLGQLPYTAPPQDSWDEMPSCPPLELTEEQLAWAVAAGGDETEQSWETIEL